MIRLNWPAINNIKHHLVELSDLIQTKFKAIIHLNDPKTSELYRERDGINKLDKERLHKPINQHVHNDEQ